MVLNEAALLRKLENLENTQESIHTLTQWVLFHEEYYQGIALLWRNMFLKSEASHKLVLLYSCNDIIQTSRKHTKVFIESFGKHLKECIAAAASVDDSVKGKVKRLLLIWRDRNIYTTDFITDLLTALGDHESVKMTSKLESESNNPLVRLYLEHEREAVDDALVTVEAGEIAREVLDYEDRDETVSAAFAHASLGTLNKYIDRAKRNLERKEELIQLLDETLGREKRSLEHVIEDLVRYETLYGQMQDVLDNRGNKKPRME